MESPSRTLILSPGTAFSDLERTLEGLGLSRRPGAPVTPPILPGEPELATWRDPAAGTRLTYTFNPAVGLRVLDFRGGDAAGLRARIEASVPVLRASEIRDLLASTDRRRVLLGLLAAGELEAVGLLGDVQPLRDHCDPLIAKAAVAVHERLAVGLVERGARELRRERAARPGRSAVFPRLGGPDERRQVLRWLIRDRQPPNDDVLAVLRSGLEDPDWEVRATAMLAAARLGAAGLWLEVKRMALPRSGRDGPAPEDRRILQAARRAVLEHLAGEPMPKLPPEAPAPMPTTAEELRAHLRRCVAGEETPWRDGIFLFFEGLASPRDDNSGPG